ncbi:uncharacterized protein LOC142351019 isoform X3 [Convolutriloba macropyga]|uniref:uncharacterized protein LOC142351019 isoform X3 n=1 Tax=Convolutriloba macropyga TaxID=536237 RepID=UPI003F525BC2
MEMNKSNRFPVKSDNSTDDQSDTTRSQRISENNNYKHVLGDHSSNAQRAICYSNSGHCEISLLNLHSPDTANSQNPSKKSKCKQTDEDSVEHDWGIDCVCSSTFNIIHNSVQYPLLKTKTTITTTINNSLLTTTNNTTQSNNTTTTLSPTTIFATSTIPTINHNTHCDTAENLLGCSFPFSPKGNRLLSLSSTTSNKNEKAIDITYPCHNNTNSNLSCRPYRSNSAYNTNASEYKLECCNSYYNNWSDDESYNLSQPGFNNLSGYNNSYNETDEACQHSETVHEIDEVNKLFQVSYNSIDTSSTCGVTTSTCGANDSHKVLLLNHNQNYDKCKQTPPKLVINTDNDSVYELPYSNVDFNYGRPLASSSDHFIMTSYVNSVDPIQETSDDEENEDGNYETFVGGVGPLVSRGPPGLTRHLSLRRTLSAPSRKIKQLFSHSGGGVAGGGSGSGDKSSANSSKTNSLTRGTIPPFSASTGRKEKKKRKQQQQDKSSDVRERDSWSVSDDGFDNDNGDEEDDDLDDDEDDLENDESGQSDDESDSNDWLESHSDNGAIAGSSNKRSASLQYSNSARGPDGQKRIKRVGGKAVAKSKQMHKQLKKAFLNLGKSPSNNSLATANNNNPSDHQHTTPIITSSLAYPHGVVHGGSGDDLLRRADGGLNSAPSGLRRTSLALSDTPLTSSTNQDASALTGRSGTGGGASSDRNSSASASSFHKALNLSLSNAVISEKDRQKQQVEKLFRKTLKEANDVQKRKEELESKMTEYRRRDPGEAAAIITRYEERLRELRLVLEGYADKLQSADPDNELVLKHLAKLRKRSNSLSNPTMMEGSLVAGGSGSNFDKGHHPMSSHDRHHRSNQDDTRSTGSHDQHRHLDLNKQLSASREEDMEHPTEGNYASDYDIKLLQEEIQSHAQQLTERWQQELETFKSEYVKRMQELNETITHKCGEVETHINTLLTQKLTELDYDLRDRNEMVEQQLATLSEDIHSIDQRTNHQVNDVETMYNDRITALEARLVDVEKSHFSGSGKSNFIEDLKDADVMTLANRILQSLLVLVISFVFVFANILKIVSNTISTPQRAIIFMCSLVFLIIAYITRESTTRWVRSLFTS